MATSPSELSPRVAWAGVSDAPHFLFPLTCATESSGAGRSQLGARAAAASLPSSHLHPPPPSGLHAAPEGGVRRGGEPRFPGPGSGPGPREAGESPAGAGRPARESPPRERALATAWRCPALALGAQAAPLAALHAAGLLWVPGAGRAARAAVPTLPPPAAGPCLGPPGVWGEAAAWAPGPSPLALHSERLNLGLP